MKAKLFEGHPTKVVTDNLESLCYAKEEMLYMRPLDDADLQAKEKAFVASNIKFAKIKDELDKIKDEFKLKMRPLEQELAAALGVLKNKAEQVEGTVYLVDEQVEGLMGYYDPQGNLINTRRLTAEERQLSITSNLQANG